jgi:hypothetical protein
LDRIKTQAMLAQAMQQRQVTPFERAAVIGFSHRSRATMGRHETKH